MKYHLYPIPNPDVYCNKKEAVPEAQISYWDFGLGCHECFFLGDLLREIELLLVVFQSGETPGQVPELGFFVAVGSGFAGGALGVTTHVSRYVP